MIVNGLVPIKKWRAIIAANPTLLDLKPTISAAISYEVLPHKDLCLPPVPFEVSDYLVKRITDWLCESKKVGLDKTSTEFFYNAYVLKKKEKKGSKPSQLGMYCFIHCARL